MPNIFKLSKTVVKVIAGIITVAFIFNSVSGLMGSLNLVDGESINTQDINPGDFKIKFDELSIAIGIDIENNGIYDYEGIIIGITFEMKNSTTDWITILDTNSSALDSNIPPEGQTIERNGGKASIVLEAEMDDFILDMDEIAERFGLNASSWDLGDLFVDDFLTRMNLTFSISYAFKQYQLDFNLFLNHEVLKEGF